MKNGRNLSQPLTCYFLPADFLFGAWVSADAATFFTGAGVFGLLKSFEAMLATLFEVFSFLVTLEFLL